MNSSFNTEILDELHRQNDTFIEKFRKDKEFLKTFLNVFPYNQLLNISTIHLRKFNTCLKLLSHLSEFEEFFENSKAVNFTLEFILINLCYTSNNSEEVQKLLGLLENILKVIFTLKSSQFDIDPERLFNIISKVTDISNFELVIAKYCGNLVKLLLEKCSETPFPDLYKCISKIFDKFNEVSAVLEACFICRFVLTRYKISSKTCENVLKWLMETAPTALLKANDVSTTEEIIFCLNLFCLNYKLEFAQNSDENFRKFRVKFDIFLVNLMNISYKLCEYSCYPGLVKEDCLNLLGLLLEDFCQKENIPKYESLKIPLKLRELPSNLHDWPQFSDKRLFFCLNFMIVSYSQLIWDHRIVLNCILDYFYTEKPTDLLVLKSIYFLYPTLVDDNNCQSLQISVLGNDLLEYWSNHYIIPVLITFCSSQLQWVLREGTNVLKIAILRQWLLNNEDPLTIMTAIRNCNAENVLLQLLMEGCTTETGKKAATLIRQMKHRQLAIEITLNLHKVVHQPSIFNCLMLSGPKIPPDLNNCLLLCAFMGIVIPMVNNEQVFRECLRFTVGLLAKLAQIPECIKEFCMQSDNIRFIFNATNTVKNKTAIEIMRLFTTITVIQKMNKCDLGTISLNFAPLLAKGSIKKFRKVLELTQHVLSSENALISIEQTSIFQFYQKILDCLHETKTFVLACHCVILLIKKEPYLAVNHLTCTQIVILCPHFVNEKTLNIFLKLFDIWLNIIVSRKSALIKVPKAAFKSFILRVSTKNKNVNVKYYLDLLNKIK